MNTLERIRKQATKPEEIDNNKPCFGIVVPPSAFTVPKGWEFVLREPFEGVSYIATVLHNAGYRVKIIDMRWEANPINKVSDNISEGIDVLGIATYEDSFIFIEELTRNVKQKYPRMPVILGGSLVTSVPSVVMNNTQADIAVLGEGELTILELMDLLADNKLDKIGQIAGLCYKDNYGNLVFSDKRAQMKNLNSLPAMNLSLWPQVQDNPQIKEILFSHSRGCYMNCSFCYRTTPQLSLKSPDKFKQELQELKNKHKFEFIYFVDLTFAIDKKRTLQICEILRYFNVRWSCMCRVENLDAEILREMRQAGCYMILYGFESLTQEILDRAHKGIRPDEIKRVINFTQEAGIQVGGLFILGLPGETKESLSRVIEFISNKGGACRVKYLSAIPGTENYLLALAKGIIKNEVEHLRWLSKERGTVDDEFLNFTDLSDEDLRSAYKKISSMYIRGPQSYEAWA